MQIDLIAKQRHISKKSMASVSASSEILLLDEEDTKDKVKEIYAQLFDGYVVA